MRITKVRTSALGWPAGTGTFERNLSSPMSGVIGESPQGHQEWGPACLVLVEVETEDGLVGIGTAGGFTDAPKHIIDSHLVPLVVDADPMDRELLWAKMYRSTVRFGQSGAVMAAISAIDIACWDLVGKSLGIPVSDLLGGSTKNRVRAYASHLYALKDHEALAQEATSYREAGFSMVKQRFGFGPSDGVDGMHKNLELVRIVREAIGDDIELAVEAYMGWDVPYAIEMEKRLRPFNVKWIEEPLMPHDLEGYRYLGSKFETPISAGEHVYTRYGFQQLLATNAITYLQPDINRVGGFTEAIKVWALAEARDMTVVPHSNESHNLHMVIARVNSPLLEYFPHTAVNTGNEMFWQLFEGEPIARDGYVDAITRPGLGITVRPETVDEFLVRGA